ncbi:hypothetical protein [Nocardia wallacei]|uniref:hypothetical protein n=1 Tax=Nocardia wallacei TaxID=480035 RepID=UPI002456C270|nr:hypothetical protein [Nocardia wallacei]
MNRTARKSALAAGTAVAADARNRLGRNDILIAYGFAGDPGINYDSTAGGPAAAYRIAAAAFDRWRPAESVRIWMIDSTGTIRHQAAGRVAEVRRAIARWPLHGAARLRFEAREAVSRARTIARRPAVGRSALLVLLLAALGLATVAAIAAAPSSVSISIGALPTPPAAAAQQHSDSTTAGSGGRDCVILCADTTPPSWSAPDTAATDSSSGGAGRGCIMLCSDASGSQSPPRTAAAVDKVLRTFG